MNELERRLLEAGDALADAALWAARATEADKNWQQHAQLCSALTKYRALAREVKESSRITPIEVQALIDACNSNDDDVRALRFALERDRQVKDLAMLVQRLVRHDKAGLGEKGAQAIDYLRRNDLIGSPLRENDNDA